jgi:uncharacterized protein YndB with AHSA1/START domain
MSADTSDREIVITRLVDAPRELIWKAWTDPQHVGNWWGPNGFTNTIHSMDVRPGGAWRYDMHGPDGRTYPNKVVYIEVVKPERLVYNHGSDEANDPSTFHVTVTFTAQGAKTLIRMHSVFPTAAAREFVVREFKAIEGGNQTLDRLEKYLPTM